MIGPSIYIAGGKGNLQRVRLAQAAAKEAGFLISHDWTQAPWLNDPSIRPSDLGRVAEEDLYGAAQGADALLAVFPAGRGTHVEIGAGLVLGHPIGLWLDGSIDMDPESPGTCAFYHHPQVIADDFVVPLLHRLRERCR